MPDPEYVRIKMLDIPDKFILEYNLLGQDCDSWVYFEILQSCYGLPQSGILANNLLCSRLVTEGFYEYVSTQDFVVINGIPSNSASSLMILVWNTWGSSTSIFSLIFSKSNMGYNSTWPATNSWASPSNRIIQENAAKSACQGT